ncbi:hypothetical protein AVEN_47091-1 [Araneus ventricosus]|uniref:Reverse transcriptase domain-containing protein n=1 Tax=Araneus ventricosus TaxID=182803 RepID=A0A4Y2CXQ0_ARAVE|nr:hypothetical protein AVEN_241092-1 [Araneus ventricosus]GBM08498.1 hypothetical protein AVEN_47091-1 [Araneus ventricosus]
MYHFNRHCFGVTCSPFVLAATIKTHIKKYKEKHPFAYEMLNESYVDDLFYGSCTIQDAFTLSSDAVSILKDSNMNMRKFDTNSKELKNVWLNSNSDIETNEHSDNHLKVLGLVWNNLDDTLEIQETPDPISWKHCSGKHNPADLLTRGLSSRDLITFIKWWHGPEWLRDAENLWPKVKEFENELVNSEVTSEYKSCVIVSSAIVQEKILDPGKFSCLRNLLRVTAWVVRFVNALKRKNAEKGPLTSDELTNAEMF